MAYARRNILTCHSQNPEEPVEGNLRSTDSEPVTVNGVLDRGWLNTLVIQCSLSRVANREDDVDVVVVDIVGERGTSNIGGSGADSYSQGSYSGERGLRISTIIGVRGLRNSIGAGGTFGTGSIPHGLMRSHDGCRGAVTY